MGGPITSDDALAREAFQRFIHAGDFESYLRQKEMEAAALVETFWGTIQAFAAKLLDERTIAGPRCEVLFHEISGHPDSTAKSTAYSTERQTA